MNFLLRCTFVVACLWLMLQASALTGNDEDMALCSTDTECMAFCPPPADDPECDGGPQ